MKKILIRFSLWLLKWCDHQPPIKTHFRDIVADEVIMKARELCSHLDSTSQMHSGEWCRAQVYRALINSYPEMSKRKLAFALEAAMQEVGF